MLLEVEGWSPEKFAGKIVDAAARQGVHFRVEYKDGPFEGTDTATLTFQSKEEVNYLADAIVRNKDSNLFKGFKVRLIEKELPEPKSIEEAVAVFENFAKKNALPGSANYSVPEAVKEFKEVLESQEFQKDPEGYVNELVNGGSVNNAFFNLVVPFLHAKLKNGTLSSLVYKAASPAKPQSVAEAVEAFRAHLAKYHRMKGSANADKDEAIRDFEEVLKSEDFRKDPEAYVREANSFSINNSFYNLVMPYLRSLSDAGALKDLVFKKTDDGYALLDEAFEFFLPLTLPGQHAEFAVEQLKGVLVGPEFKKNPARYIQDMSARVKFGDTAEGNVISFLQKLQRENRLEEALNFKVKDTPYVRPEERRPETADKDPLIDEAFQDFLVTTVVPGTKPDYSVELLKKIMLDPEFKANPERYLNALEAKLTFGDMAKGNVVSFLRKLQKQNRLGEAVSYREKNAPVPATTVPPIEPVGTDGVKTPKKPSRTSLLDEAAEYFKPLAGIPGGSVESSLALLKKTLTNRAFRKDPKGFLDQWSKDPSFSGAATANVISFLRELEHENRLDEAANFARLTVIE